jgi:hypothetical protein
MTRAKLIKIALTVTGAIVMTVSLSSFGWLGGKILGAEASGGLVSVEMGNFYGELEPRAWSPTDEEGRSRSVFKTAGVSAAIFGGIAAALYFIFSLLSLVGLTLQKVRFDEQLRLGFIELEGRTLRTKFHPSRLATRIGLLGCIWSGLFVHLAPETLSYGWAWPLYLGSFLVTVGAAYVLDRQTLLASEPE